MNLYFRDSYGKKRLIASDLQSKEVVWEHIQKFLDDHNFKSYYTRMWYADGYTWYDVGSHTEFFCVDANLMEKYEDEQEEEKLYTTQHKEINAPLVIDQNKLNRQKVYHSVDFRTGKYMTQKDRPRKRYKAKGVNLYDV